jgi:hypothetical protein
LRKFVQKHRFQVITKALREIFLNHEFQWEEK